MSKKKIVYGIIKNKKFLKLGKQISGYTINDENVHIYAFFCEPEQLGGDIKKSTEIIEKYENSLLEVIYKPGITFELLDSFTGKKLKNPYYLKKILKHGGCRETRTRIIYILLILALIDLYFGITTKFLYMLIKWISLLF